MRKKLSVSLFFGFVFCLLSIGASRSQAVEAITKQTLSEEGVGYIGLPNQSLSSRSPSSFEFAYLKQSVGLWADGKGDALLEQHVTNKSPEAFDRLTWYFEWPAADYSNIHAKDSTGALTVEKSVDGSGIYLTVIFRKPVPQNSTYQFKLFITIGGMASGSGNNWSANWYTAGDSGIKIFEEVLALPANASVTSVEVNPKVWTGR